MNRSLLLLLLMSFIFTGCQKDETEQTKEQLLQGTWSYNRFEYKYYDSADQLEFTKTGLFSDLIKLTFEGQNLSRKYTSGFSPETAPYTITEEAGKLYIDAPYQGRREKYEVVFVSKDEMLWIQEKENYDYLNLGYKTAAKAVLITVIKRDK